MRRIGCLLLIVAAMLARGWAQAVPAPATPPSSAQTAPAQVRDPLAQMRDDLNRLESLNLNMSSEIEFLRDQNLQILLRTNSQMWTVLIRDLRRQIEQEEQQQSTAPRPVNPTPPGKSSR